MEKTIKTLKTFFIMPFIILLMLVGLFESELLLPGGVEMSEGGRFVVLSVMELATLAVIPFSLYMFRMGKVRRQLQERKAPALLYYGRIRLLLLGGMLVLNTLLYYMSDLRPAYAYLAIILLIAMAFVYPSRNRCDAETRA